jgi:hypothetical protein
MIELFSVSIVPQPYGSIISSRNEAVVQRRDSKIIELTRVECENEVSFISVRVILPQSTKGILDYPIITLNFYPIDVGWAFIFGLEVNFLFRLDEVVKFFIRFSLIDGLGIPKSNKAILSSGNDLLVIVTNELNMAFMARSLSIDTHHRFNEVTLPEEQFSVFRGTENISIFEFSIGSYI